MLAPTLALGALAEAGTTTPAARRVAVGRAAISSTQVGIFTAAARSLLARGVPAGARVWAVFVPGRIEVLGKHTDYGGGRSLLAATDQGICLVGAPRAQTGVSIHDVLLDERVELSGGGGGGEADAFHGPAWGRYAAVVLRRLHANFPGSSADQGTEIAFGSNLPAAAGMSSSSALLTALFLACAASAGREQYARLRERVPRAEDLAGYLGAVEGGYRFGALAGEPGVGTSGGSEDHTAILLAERGRLVQYAFDPVRRERALAMPAEYTFAVAVSGIVAEKAGTARAAFNRLSALVAALLERWEAETGERAANLAAIAADGERSARLAGLLRSGRREDDRQLLERFEHFRTESEEIVPAVEDLDTPEAIERFARLVARSQAECARRLANQVPETIFLASVARDLGAAAASAFGAGFGGSVWALVEKNEATTFLERWKRAYLTRFPEPTTAAHARFLATGAGAPARFLTHGPGSARLPRAGASPDEGWRSRHLPRIG